MSTGRYFVTDEQEEAKNWRMVHNRKVFRGNLARLEDEMKQFAASWVKLGRAADSPRSRVFEFDEEEIWVTNDRGQPIERLPWRHFDKARIEDLLVDLKTAKGDLAMAEENVKALGID
jgi:hypothetical protein